MAKGKYKKKRKKAQIAKEVLITTEKLNEWPGNTIPGYCFTDKGICDKINPTTHTCMAYINPEDKCRLPNPNYGCQFSPIMRPEKVDKKITISGRKSKKKRAGKVRSQTAGIVKGIRATPLERYCAKYARAYKHPEYGDVIRSFGKGK
jgi:hypothetical protein